MDAPLVQPLSSKLRTLPRVARETLYSRVYDGLRELLMDSRVAPGDEFSIRQLAAAVGTSTQPVREAVRHLVAENALELLPNRAVRVPLMTARRYEELARVRCVLEGFAVEEAARRISPAELEALRENLREHEALAIREDLPLDDLHRLDKEFYHQIYRAARLPSMLPMIESLWMQVRPTLSLVLDQRVQNRHQYYNMREHREHLGAMLQALEQEDGARLRSLLEARIQRTARFVIERHLVQQD